MDPINITIITAVFFIAAFYGSLIGGAALLTIPTLIFFGLNPHMAIGTNKIGAFGHATGASLGYGIEKKINYKLGFIFMIFAVIGSVFGSLTILSVPEQFIKKVIGVIMIVIAIFLLFNKDLGMKFKKKKRSFYLLGLLAIAIGFYNGFYGAGAGIISRFIISAVLGFMLINSAALVSFSHIAESLISLAVFAFYGVVQFSLFIPIILASFLGAYLGSKYGVKRGNFFVKRLLLIISIIMAIKLLFF